MEVTLDIPEKAVRRLEAEGRHRGMSVDDLIAEFAASLPAVSSGPRRRPAFVAVGASAKGITDRIDDSLSKRFGRD